MVDQGLALDRWCGPHPCQLAGYTVLGMMPTNNKLKAISENDAGPTSRTMIETWGRLHAVRTSLGIAAAFAYLWALN